MTKKLPDTNAINPTKDESLVKKSENTLTNSVFPKQDLYLGAIGEALARQTQMQYGQEEKTRLAMDLIVSLNLHQVRSVQTLSRNAFAMRDEEQDPEVKKILAEMITQEFPQWTTELSAVRKGGAGTINNIIYMSLDVLPFDDRISFLEWLFGYKK